MHFQLCLICLLLLLPQYPRTIVPQANQANYIVKEPTGKAQCLLILLPGLGNSAESVFDDTEMETLAAQNGIVTIVPNVKTNIYLDDVSYENIANIAKTALQRYSIDRKHIIIGGFSAGGSIALLFTERANRQKAEIQPQAVFAIDPPVNLAHLWTTYKKSIQQNPSSLYTQEAITITQYLQELTGGTPAEKPEQYAQYSVFTPQKRDGGNIQFLKNVPIHIYCEPDTAWYKVNRGYEYQDLNAYCSIAMIKKLQKFGNTQAQVVITSNKGYRRDGRRHPHSWSILDPNDCIQWLRQIRMVD